MWECECDRSAGEVNEGERGAGGVEPVRPTDDQLHLVVQGLRSGVAQLKTTGGEDPLAVLADRFPEPDKGGKPATGETGEQPIEQLADRLDGEAGREDRSDHLLHRPGARELPAAGADRGKGDGLTVAEVVGVFEQRPAVCLKLLGDLGLAGAAQLVSVLAADLV